MRTWLRSGLIAFTVLVILGLAALDGLQWRAGQQLKSGPGTSPAQVGLQTDAAARAAHDNDGLKAEVTKLTAMNESLTTLVATRQPRIRTLRKQTTSLNQQLTISHAERFRRNVDMPVYPLGQLDAYMKPLDLQEGVEA